MVKTHKKKVCVKVEWRLEISWGRIGGWGRHVGLYRPLR